MQPVLICNPFVPPEWIAAHGRDPVWFQPGSATFAAGPSVHRGQCDYASELVAQVNYAECAGAIVLTTTCDQMRYAAAYLEQCSVREVFLFNVPSTWQHATARRIYRDELERLSRFLRGTGNQRPDDQAIVDTCLRYDRARTDLRIQGPAFGDRSYPQRLAAVRGPGEVPAPPAGNGEGHVRLAVLGGPLQADDYETLRAVAQSGGQIVLDGSEGGERTLPAQLDPQRLARAPLDELTRAYFDTIPDVFRRPHTALRQWFERELAARRVAGVLFWRHAFCDLWHAELEPLRQWCPVPVLDIEATQGQGSARQHTLGRLEAFLEMLP